MWNRRRQSLLSDILFELYKKAPDNKMDFFELSRAFVDSPSEVEDVLDELEEKNIIEKTLDQEKKLYSLTPSGRKIVKECIINDKNDKNEDCQTRNTNELEEICIEFIEKAYAILPRKHQLDHPKEFSSFNIQGIKNIFDNLIEILEIEKKEIKYEQGLIHKKCDILEKDLATNKQSLEYWKACYEDLEQSIPLNQRVVSFLTEIPNIHSEDGQQSLLNSASLDRELHNQLIVGKPPTIFIESLVSTCRRYGKLQDGRSAIEAILSAAKNRVGTDKQKLCERLLEVIKKSSW